MDDASYATADEAYLQDAVKRMVMPVAQEEGVGNMGISLAIDLHAQLRDWHRSNGGLTEAEVEQAAETFRDAYRDRIPVHGSQGVAAYGESRDTLLNTVAEDVFDGAYEPTVTERPLHHRY